MRTLVVFVVFSLCSVCLGDWQWFQVLPNTPAQDTPTPRYHHTFTEVGVSTGILQGGFNLNTGTFLNDTWIYLADNKAWKRVPDQSPPIANLARAYATANSYKEEVILYGGVSAAGDLSDLWRFTLNDPNPSWKKDTYASVPGQIAPLLSRQYHGAAIVEETGKMYVFGGHVAAVGATSNDLLSYDLNTKQWTLIQAAAPARHPLARQGHSFTYFNDKTLGDVLIMFGGYSDKPYTGGYNDTWRYVISSNKWEQIGGSDYGPEGRYGHDAAIVSDTLILYGGISTHNIDFPPTYDVFYSDVWTLDLNVSDADLEWDNNIPTDDPTGPGPRQGQQVALLNGYFTNVAGYVQYFGVVNDVWYLIYQN